MSARFAALPFFIAAVAICSEPAHATPHPPGNFHFLNAQLNGVEMQPATSSLAYGDVQFLLDETNLWISVQSGNYTGLLSNPTSVDIHGPAGVGANGPSMLALNFSPGTSGTITGNVLPLSATQVAQILAGNSYISIQTTGMPQGEIRGQILEWPVAAQPYCSGDGSLATACPCSPPNIVPSPPAAPQHGCANSFDLNGAVLKAMGNTSPDTVKFLAKIGKGSAAFGFLLKGNGSDWMGLASGDGVLCVSGALIRFGSHFAGTNGAPLGLWTYPNSVQTIPVSAATLQSPGTDSYYQLFYRNSAPNFCSPNGWNVSSAVWIPWP